MKIRSLIIALISAATTGLGGWLALTAVLELNEASTLQRDGTLAQATISQKWIVAGESRNKSHLIRYVFNTGEEDVAFERPVPVPLHRVVNDGSVLEVRFTPGRPELHEVFPGQLSGAARSKLIGGLIICGVGLFVFLMGGVLSLFKRKESDV